MSNSSENKEFSASDRFVDALLETKAHYGDAITDEDFLAQIENAIDTEEKAGTADVPVGPEAQAASKGSSNGRAQKARRRKHLLIALTTGVAAVVIGLPLILGNVHQNIKGTRPPQIVAQVESEDLYKMSADEMSFKKKSGALNGKQPGSSVVNSAPAEANPVTAGLRSGARGIDRDTVDALISADSEETIELTDVREPMVLKEEEYQRERKDNFANAPENGADDAPNIGEPSEGGEVSIGYETDYIFKSVNEPKGITQAKSSSPPAPSVAQPKEDAFHGGVSLSVDFGGSESVGSAPALRQRFAGVGHAGDAFAPAAAPPFSSSEMPLSTGSKRKGATDILSEPSFPSGKKLRRQEIVLPQKETETHEELVKALQNRIRAYEAGNAYAPLIDNPWQTPAEEPLSTFSIDVDTAAYTQLRRAIQGGVSLGNIQKDSIRIEEMINYFSYGYEKPKGDDPFALNIESSACPWNSKHQLLRVGVQGSEMERRERPGSNIVFLVDVSGSMQSPDKLGLVKKTLLTLAEEMTEKDHLAMVVYAGSEGVALESTPGNQQDKIREAIEKLEAGGSTNGGAGIRRAYKIAEKQFKKDGVNRVILCTDGDFNVGTTNRDDLIQLVEKKAESGVFLTVAGFGSGNLNDSMMEAITNKGNGNYFYIDSFQEARKVFLRELMSTLVTIAKDVKIQIEFNPAHVAEYRLIGYANRKLEAEDFDNDEVDAGEIGAGHAVTALYEVVPVGAKTALRYQKTDAPKVEVPAEKADELAWFKLRYKKPDEDKSNLIENAVKAGNKADLANASADYKFASAVAYLGLQLRQHESVKTKDLDDVIALAKEAQDGNPDGARAEFLKLVKQLKKNGQ